jgi:hypothetical protein
VAHACLISIGFESLLSLPEATIAAEPSLTHDHFNREPIERRSSLRRIALQHPNFAASPCILIFPLAICRTSKMSHDRSRRDSCEIQISNREFHSKTE